MCSTAYLRAYIISDTGKGLARCNGCGPAASGLSDSAAVHGNVGDSWAQWRIYPLGNNKIVIQSIDTGKYVGRCNGCWYGGAYADSAFVHVTDPSASYAQWTVATNSDFTYSLQSDTGKYLARCNGCVPGGAKSDFAFVHATDPSQAYVKWRFQYF